MARPFQRLTCAVFAIATIGITLSSAEAQTLRWDALGSAGGRASGGPVGLGLTVGQPVTGRAVNATLQETVGFWHPLAPVVTDVGRDGPEPFTAFALVAIVPNPSPRATTIHFTTPVASSLIIEIVDLSGRIVRELVSGRLEAGRHRVAWDGRAANGSLSPSGIYFCRLEGAGHQAVRRLAIVR